MAVKARDRCPEFRPNGVAAWTHDVESVAKVMSESRVANRCLETDSFCKHFLYSRNAGAAHPLRGRALPTSAAY